METMTINQTLAQLDAEMDFTELDEAIEAAKPYGCRTIEFIDDNSKRGYRALEYKVEVVARHEHDEDGWSPKYEWYPVSVKVTDTMTVDGIVFMILGEINHLIES